MSNSGISHTQLELGSAWFGHLVSGSHVDVHAPFKGSIQTSQHVIIREGPEVECEIKAASLVVESGAKFRGRVRIGLQTITGVDRKA